MHVMLSLSAEDRLVLDEMVGSDGPGGERLSRSSYIMWLVKKRRAYLLARQGTFVDRGNDVDSPELHANVQRNNA